MKSQTNEEGSLRKPRDILKAMDSTGTEIDPILLAQLNAELLVSLAYEEEKVSKRNLTVACISCGVAIVALLISVLHYLPIQC